MAHNILLEAGTNELELLTFMSTGFLIIISLVSAQINTDKK